MRLSEYVDARGRPEHLVQWHPTRNGDLKPDEVMPGSNRHLWWQCERGHEWRARAFSVKAGCGCPYCAGKKAILGETDLATVRPDLAAQWYSEKNESLTPQQITPGSEKRVWWLCDRGHPYQSAVFSRVAGTGCPYCAGKRAIPGETDLATLRPELMEQWDFEKNTLDPAEVTVAAHDKVWWKCSLGHSWQAMVFSRTKEKGSGCPYCTGRLVLPGFNDLGTLRPQLAAQWHQPLNGALKPEDVTLGSNKKVWWKCEDDHVWCTAIFARTRVNGTGCPVCAGRTKKPGKGA